MHLASARWSTPPCNGLWMMFANLLGLCPCCVAWPNRKLGESRPWSSDIQRRWIEMPSPTRINPHAHKQKHRAYSRSIGSLSVPHEMYSQRTESCNYMTNIDKSSRWAADSCVHVYVCNKMSVHISYCVMDLPPNCVDPGVEWQCLVVAGCR